MSKETPAALLRIFLDEGDKYQGKPLYEELVLAARSHGLAGATVLRGPVGYGKIGQLHTAKILRLAEHLPMVVEIVDEETKIREFLDRNELLLETGLVTLERVSVWHPS